MLFGTPGGLFAEPETGIGSGTVTNVSIVTANGLAGTVANPTSTPAITLSTSVTGVLKGNGTAISAATAGVDYGTVTSASIVTANGLAGTVANPTSTPAITLSTSVTGVLKGNGTAISAATAGVDYGTVTSASIVTANGISGTVATATSTPAITLTLGDITPSTMKTTSANTATHQQIPSSSALTSSSGLTAWNVDTNQNATYTLTENTQLSNPTNMVANAIYMIRITQAATPQTLTFDTAYKFPGGFAPVVSTGSGAVDILTFRSTGARMELIGLAQNES